MTIAQLTFAEQILIWAARRIQISMENVPADESDLEARREMAIRLVGSELAVAFDGVEGAKSGFCAAERLALILTTFACAGIRPLALGPLCSTTLTSDERLLLSYLAACQSGESGQVNALLSYLFPPAGARIAIRHGCELAAILKRGMLAVPLRLRVEARPCCPIHDPAVSATLH